MLFVPGPNDPGPAAVLPRPPLPSYFTETLAEEVRTSFRVWVSALALYVHRSRSCSGGKVPTSIEFTCESCCRCPARCLAATRAACATARSSWSSSGTTWSTACAASASCRRQAPCTFLCVPVSVMCSVASPHHSVLAPGDLVARVQIPRMIACNPSALATQPPALAAAAILT